MHRNIVSGPASILRERRLYGIIMHPLTQVQASKYVKALVQLRGVQDRGSILPVGSVVQSGAWGLRGSEESEHQLLDLHTKKLEKGF
jgi:hypothetical protein